MLAGIESAARKEKRVEVVWRRLRDQSFDRERCTFVVVIKALNLPGFDGQHRYGSVRLAQGP